MDIPLFTIIITARRFMFLADEIHRQGRREARKRTTCRYESGLPRRPPFCCSKVRLHRVGLVWFVVFVFLPCLVGVGF